MRRYLYLTAALLLLCLTACGVPRGQEGAYQLYFRAQEGEQANHPKRERRGRRRR